MRLLLSILGVFAAVACFEKPAAAQTYPWCAYYGPTFGATNCGFSTFQQCLATVSGIGGNCGANPMYSPHRDHISRPSARGAILIKRLRLPTKAPATSRYSPQSAVLRCNVRFSPKSGHRLSSLQCPLGANSRHQLTVVTSGETVIRGGKILVQSDRAIGSRCERIALGTTTGRF